MENRYAEMLELARQHVAEGRLGKNDTNGRFPTNPIAVYLRGIKPELTADEIDSGSYWRLKYAAVADHYGYPAWIAALHNSIFSGLPTTEALDWHVQIAETIATYGESVDWRKALHRTHIGILSLARQAIPSVRGDATAHGDGAQCVTRVAALHETALRGETPDESEWDVAAEAALVRAHLDDPRRETISRAGNVAARAAHCSAKWSPGAMEAFAYLAPVWTSEAADYAAMASALLARHGVEWSHTLPLLEVEWHPGESVLPFVESVLAHEIASIEEYSAAESTYEAALITNYRKLRDLTISAIRDTAAG
jgi:hypothetical protein